MRNRMKTEVTNKLWKKMLSVILSVIIAFGTVVTIIVGSSRLQDWLGIQSMLSAYASDIVDIHGVVAVDEESMLADHNVIDLENKDGSNTLYLFSEPISFVDENGKLKTKDISVERQTEKKLKEQGYDYTNGQNDYRINFSSDSDKGLYIESGDCTYSIIPESDKVVAGNESTSEILKEQFEDFEYPNIYGEGTNLKFYPQLNGVKDEIVLNSNIGQNVFSFKLETENCSAVLNDDGTVSLINNNGESVQTFSAPYAYDSAYIEGYADEHYSGCVYALKETSENEYTLSITVDESWLGSESTVYPVTIDPTTSNVYDSADAGVYSKYPSNNYGNEQTGCFGKASDYGYGRVYEKFNIPSAIQKGATIHYAYHWVRETTGRTASTYVRPFLVTSSWSETGITWSNKAGYETTTNTNWKNINSNSKDSENNPYWYNYNLVNCVKKWINGTANNGVVFVSGEEVDEVQKYEWRAFASRTYSTSSMRPYTVISYTNDTTAPTATVTADTTDWTNGNVTLTISGAADNSGGAGLHAQPYSFSTISGTYAWGTAASKFFSANTTVYVSVRDALGNIRTYTQKITNIDKTAPTIASVTGNPADWTNGSVTLTANGATDSESGLDAAAYSFSAESGSYSWQESNSKVFSENTTVYVYARDKAGNISAPTEIVIDKLDYTAPSVPEVTGNSESWTNGDIVLTAQSTDDLSGVAKYSFSAEKDKFSWQSENTFTATEPSVIYVCAKDNAGNISEPAEIDLKIDRLAPTGTASAEVTDWVKEVAITANADDTMSGLAANPYCFTTEKDKYIWQSSNSKTVYENGTYYVYARDAVGNINLIDTIVVDKIDAAAPVIDNVDVQENGNMLTVTVTAADAQSGVAEYSVDNGITWQAENTFTIDKNAVNYYAVKVRDKVGNVSCIGRAEEFSVPRLYFENEILFLYNTGADAEGKMYYKFSAADKWQEYADPITVPENASSVYVSFYEKDNVTAADETALNFEYSNKLTYTESNVDMTMTYRNVRLNITRQYVNEEWQYSFDSTLSLKNDDTLLEIRLTDFNTYSFVKQSKYKYVSEISGRTVTVVYDENDENVVEYILKADKINYHYSPDGLLVKTDNAYGLLYSFTRSENTLVITDGAERETIISFTADGIASITDANGGIVHYEYDNGNLVKVTDQSGAVVSEYEYTNGVITKSGYTSISRDAQNRVTQLLNDNGYYVNYEYAKRARTFTLTTPDGKNEKYSYDIAGNITEYHDSDGKVTYYSQFSYFDKGKYHKRIDKSSNGSTCYNDYLFGNKIVMELDFSEYSNNYFYDDNGNLIRAEKLSFSNEPDKKNYFIYYIYDDNGNLTLQATLDTTNMKQDDIPKEYNVDTEYESVVKYWYENGLVTKTEDVTNNTITIYQYDQYGNVLKTTTEVTKDGETTVSMSESAYDILGRVISTKSGDSETVYTYDAAGRTLLINGDGLNHRTVYDNYGRTVQEIEDADYNPDLDNLPNAYGDTTVGQRYIYDSTGNLVKEINRFDLETDYIYSDDGLLYTQHFDIYDYYYDNRGNCTKVTVNDKTVVEYKYVVKQGKTSEITTTYANNDTERQAFDKDGNVIAKYENKSNKPYFQRTKSTDSVKEYTNDEIHLTSNIQAKQNGISITKKGISYDFCYSIETNEDIKKLNEKHFFDIQNDGYQNFSTEISENSIKFSSAASNITYTVDDDENSATEIISSGDNTVLLSNTVLDENGILRKTYDAKNIAFHIEYDDNGNIISDENSSYTYDEYGELTETTGSHNSSYTYDDRGNMISKTVDGETTTFSYDNPEWQDQLTSVNGVELTYDKAGNLSKYGDKTFSWRHGKYLSGIGLFISYKYDENGIRTSKTVNNKTTVFDVLGSKILAQKNDEAKIYFQYNGDTPIGFILNDVQYFYITNLSGDIVGITDENGELIAEYSYDEWGKLLSITTAEEGNEEQQKIAELNPFRYRGYYYDNETGYYYLQSRYYDPELGRFISADGFGYVNNSKPLNINAYAYCLNNPIAYVDPVGTERTISGTDQGIAVAEIITTMFLCLDALARGFISFGEKAGENFATLIASMVVLDKSILYPSGNTSEERHKNFENWYQGVFDDFSQFIKSSFYKIVNLIQPDFFFQYFTNLIETKNNFYRLKIKNLISVSFSIGKNDVLENLANLADGKFKLFDVGNITTGFILHADSKGAYIEKSFEFVKNFFGGLSLDVEFKEFNFPHIDSGLAVNTDFLQYGLAWYILIAILGVTGAAALAGAM